MTKSSIAVIREACIKANPEILGGHFFEIGFANCKYCSEPRLVRERISKPIVVDEGGGSIHEVSERTIDTTDFPCLKHFSRPIRLADVLLAIQKKKSEFVDFDNDNSIKEGAKDFQDTVLEVLDKYNLRQDSIELQTPEFQAFLASLLGKE